MAILKHYSVHNSNYYDAVLYLTYEHDNHARPVYDEHGLMIERENLLIDGINTDVYSYATIAHPSAESTAKIAQPATSNLITGSSPLTRRMLQNVG